MYKRNITYTDYNGNERTETAYFNLSEAELTDWNFSKGGGLAERLQRIMDSKNAPEIMSTFKQVLKKSYGVKSDDGRQLIKSKKLFKNKFKASGYRFKGWAIKPNGEVKYKDRQKVKNLTNKGKTVKLFAVWEKK